MSSWLIIGTCVGVVVVVWIVWKWLAPAAPDLRTDGNAPVPDANRAKDMPDPCTPPCTKSPNAAQAAADAKAGKTFIRHSAKGCNCVGFALGRGDWEIETTHLPKILEDNYGSPAEGDVAVCCVVLWSVDGVFDHIGMVVEVEKGADNRVRAKVVRSKAATSHFVYDHPLDYPPYGPGVVYCRKSMDKLPQAARDAFDQALAAYNAIKDKSSADAHNAAERLCQARNALVGTE